MLKFEDMKTKNLHAILILILSLFTIKGNVLAQSLDYHIQEAIENNPGLKGKYAAFEASLQKVTQVKSLEDPTLSLGYGIRPIETRLGARRANISLGQIFPWFGTLKAKGDAASLFAEAKYQEYIQAKNLLVYHVKQAYFPLYELEEHIKWHEENLAILDTYKTLATNSFANGKGTMVDVLRTDIMIDNIKLDIKILNDRLLMLHLTFNKLFNRKDSLAVELIDTFSIGENLNRFKKDESFIHHPLIMALDKKIEAAHSNEIVANKQGMPKVGIEIDYAFISPRNDVGSTGLRDNGQNALMPMVSVSLPIFRNKYRASIKETQFVQEAMELQKLELKNTLSASYEKVRYEMEKASQLWELYDTKIVKTQQIINLLFSDYSNSGNDFDEILLMQQQMLKYNMAKATFTKDYFLAKSEMEYLTANQEQ